MTVQRLLLTTGLLIVTYLFFSSSTSLIWHVIWFVLAILLLWKLSKQIIDMLKENKEDIKEIHDKVVGEDNVK